jgi:hypothetical protein
MLQPSRINHLASCWDGRRGSLPAGPPVPQGILTLAAPPDRAFAVGPSTSRCCRMGGSNNSTIRGAVIRLLLDVTSIVCIAWLAWRKLSNWQGLGILESLWPLQPVVWTNGAAVMFGCGVALRISTARELGDLYSHRVQIAGGFGGRAWPCRVLSSSRAARSARLVASAKARNAKQSLSPGPSC